MLSLEPEIESIRPLLGDATADALIARERREIFSIYPELRICAWVGAVLLASAAGVVLKNNLARIGPLALVVLMAMVAAACYAWVWWRRARATLVDDYILLLGALLISGDVAFAEAQFHLLGSGWPRHFLIVAILHGVAAYAYNSRALLTLSITALAAWLGIERRGLEMFDQAPKLLAPRAFLSAGVVAAWRIAHQQWKSARPFAHVFEHFVAIFAFVGFFALMASDDTRSIGAIAAVAFAAFVVYWGFRVREESFVLYSFVVAAISFAVFAIEITGARDEQALPIIVVTMVAAIVGLVTVHRRFSEVRA